jgi:hypothetical protein
MAAAERFRDGINYQMLESTRGAWRLEPTGDEAPKRVFRVDRPSVDRTAEKSIDDGANEPSPVEHVAVLATDIRHAAIEFDYLTLEKHNRHLHPIFTKSAGPSSWSSPIVGLRRSVFGHSDVIIGRIVDSTNDARRPRNAALR